MIWTARSPGEPGLARALSVGAAGRPPPSPDTARLRACTAAAVNTVTDSSSLSRPEPKTSIRVMFPRQVFPGDAERRSEQTAG